MQPRLPSPRLGLLLAALVLASGLPARADTIRLVDGSTLDSVRVTGESFKEVLYRKGKVPSDQKIDASKVASIEYSSTTSDYRKAVDTLGSGEDGALLVAAGYFELVADDDSVPAWIRATARLRQAECLLDNGNHVDATAAFDALLREHSQTRHMPRALLGKGKALLYGGRLDEAGAALDKLVEEVAAKGLGAQYALEAEFLKLLAKQEAGPGKKKEAEYLEELAAAFTALRAKAAPVSPGLAWSCATRLARVKLALNRSDEALALFDEIIDARLETEPEVAADAFNGRGRCFYARGQKQLDAAIKTANAGDKPKGEAQRVAAMKDFERARLDFLRVVVNYPTVQAQQPEALYWAAQAFTQVGDEGAQLESKKLLYRCSRGYPNSRWGKQAAQG